MASGLLGHEGALFWLLPTALMASGWPFSSFFPFFLFFFLTFFHPASIVWPESWAAGGGRPLCFRMSAAVTATSWHLCHSWSLSRPLEESQAMLELECCNADRFRGAASGSPVSPGTEEEKRRKPLSSSREALFPCRGSRNGHVERVITLSKIVSSFFATCARNSGVVCSSFPSCSWLQIFSLMLGSPACWFLFQEFSAGATAAARPSAGSQAASLRRCQAAASSSSLPLASGAAIAKPCWPRSILGVVVRRPLRRAGSGEGERGTRGLPRDLSQESPLLRELLPGRADGSFSPPDLFAAGTFVAWRVATRGPKALPVQASLPAGWEGKETYAVREGERRLWPLPDSVSHRLPNWKPRMASKGPAASASPESSNAGGTSGNSSNGDSTGQDSTFECNICLDTAKDAVISLCGHLFCWPCLHQWLETRPNRQVCPVCKAGISRDKVIPLYGRGSTGQQDPREKTPPRPQGQRPEPENRGGFQGFGFGDGGFQMSFGIGAFPFGIFATAFNINDGRPPPAVPGTPQYVDEQFLSRLFLFVALVIMFWLLIA